MVVALLQSCKKDSENADTKLEVVSVYIGNVKLTYAINTQGAPLNQEIRITFSLPVDTARAVKYILLKNSSGDPISGIRYSFEGENRTVVLKPSQSLSKNQGYTISITTSMKGAGGEAFSGTSYTFTTISGTFTLKSLMLQNKDITESTAVYNVPVENLVLVAEFSEALDTVQAASRFQLGGSPVFNVSFSADHLTATLNCTSKLEGWTKYSFLISGLLTSATGNSFAGSSRVFITELDSSLKFSPVSDDELLTRIQQQTFRYFYDYAHPACGLSRERFGSGDIVTSGGSGFGVMALIVGMERGFITRQEGTTRMEKILYFLETCDRFHGAWSHWINGNNGHVYPFSTKDNGGDLVETAYMAQGLITMRQYLDPGDNNELTLINRINALLDSIEWDWYRRDGQNVLYWHWSPTYNWDMNFQIRGYNETLITYVMAAASTTHTIPAIVYQSGFARNGGIINGKSFYGYPLPVGYDYGGPLFFAHYSFLGLDPRNLQDSYANYWTQNVNHSLINWAYCVDNPKNYPNYNDHCWGLTASDIPNGYSANEPTNDKGVISPTAAISSLPYSPEQSMAAIRFFYYILGDKLWGDYGFYDAFDVHSGWWADSFIAIDQGPEICMIENYRSGLLWNLFMSAPEIQAGLTKLGFTY